ncbi:MAG: AsmA family protein [Planctomycetota bacterium]|nr:AsmA family protein [Planctomycetota bacterium]
MKWFKRIALAVVVLIIVALSIVYAYLNSIVRSEVQQQTQASLNVPTTLGAAHLSLFGGKVGLNDLELGSPPNFSAPHMLSLGGLEVEVKYGQLTSQPIHVDKISIDQPVLFIQQSGGILNFKAMMDQMPKTDKEPMKLIIDDLEVTNAIVNIQPGIPGLPDNIAIPIPSVSLKNVGNSDGASNGAAIKDVVMQLTAALTAQAEASGKLPINLNQLLNSQLSDVTAKLGGAFNKQITDITGSLGKNLPGNVGNLLNGAVGDQTKQIQQGLGGLLGGKKLDTTRP